MNIPHFILGYVMGMSIFGILIVLATLCNKFKVVFKVVGSVILLIVCLPLIPFIILAGCIDKHIGFMDWKKRNEL